MRWFVLPFVGLTVMGLASAQPVPTKVVKPVDEPKKDTRVEPTSWGNVFGRVYDAQTGMPIKDAVILGNTDNGFEIKGRSTGKTDALGGYQIQLILGRISHNFDLGRALLSSPIGMLFGTATNTTKRIDVSRVALAVSADGYKSFQGVVTARTTDAGKFRIDVQPVLLTRERDSGVSVAAVGWNAIRIANVEAQPSIAGPKDKITFRAYLRATNEEMVKTTEMAAYSDLWKGPRKLKADPSQASNGLTPYVGEYQVSGKEKLRAFPIWFAVTKSKVDYDPAKSLRYALVQIAAVGDGRSDFETREAGLRAYRERKLDEARDAFGTLMRRGTKEPFDWELASAIHLRLGDPNSAIDPAAKLWESNPQSLFHSEQYVAVLYQAGKDAEVISTCEGILKGVKEKDLAKKISADTLGQLGLSYLRKTDLKSADRINDSLLKIPGSGVSGNVIEFRGKLRLAEVEAANAANPQSATALAEYGRALLDLGRFEEAVAKLAESAALDSAQPAVQRDIAWAVLQMRGTSKAPVDLAKAVAESKSLLGLEKGQQKSKDFFSWNQYGILLFALADQKSVDAPEEAAKLRDESIEALREALSLGRVGAKRNSGYFSGFQFGYMSGSEVAISGFAYPQANATFLLLDALRKLRKDPLDQVALLNASTALLDSGQIQLASKYTDKLVAANGTHIEGRFVEALVKHRMDDLDAAAASLKRVLEVAPNHPRANLVLADILTEQGDAVGAAERAAAHAAFYGEVERR